MDSMLTGISCSCPCLCCVYKIDVIIICFIIYLLITRRIGQKMMSDLTSFALPIVPEEERSDIVDDVLPASQSDDQTMSTDSSRMPISSLSSSSSSSTTSNSPSTSPDSSSHEQFSSSTDHHPGYMHRDSNSSLAPHSSSGISSIDMNSENESIKNHTNMDLMINPATTNTNHHHLIYDNHNSRAHNYMEKYSINDNVMDSLTSCSSAYSTLKRKLIKPNIDLKLDSTESEDNDEEEGEDQSNGNNNNNNDIHHQHRRFSLNDDKCGPDNRHEDEHHFYSLNYHTSPSNRNRGSKNYYYCPKSNKQTIKSERNHKQQQQQQNLTKNATPQFVYSDTKYHHHHRSGTTDSPRTLSKNSDPFRKHHHGMNPDDDDDDRDEIMTDDSGPFSIDVKPSTHGKPSMEPLVLEAIEVNYNYDLSLSFRELRHIRKALARAELDSIGFARCVKEDIRRGKLCSACLKTKFRLFGPWPINCRLCERPVCSRCSTNVRISNQQYNRIPIKLLVPNRTMDSPIFNRSQPSPALSRSISTPTSGTSRCDYVGGGDNSNGGSSSSNRSTPSDNDRKANRMESNTTSSSMETDDELGHEDFESSSVSNSVGEEDEERSRTESRVSTDSRQSLADKWSSSWSWLRRTSVHSLDDGKSFLALKMCLDCELFYHSIAQFK